MTFERELPAYAAYRQRSGVGNLQNARSKAEMIRNPWSHKPGDGNLSAQGEITNSDPALAERLREKAASE